MNAPAPRPQSANRPAVTREVAQFVGQTRYEDLPDAVIALGKKSIIDGLGLALSGSVAKSGEIVRRYLQALGTPRRAGHGDRLGPEESRRASRRSPTASEFTPTTMTTRSSRSPPDRVYGLLTHPTAPALPVRARRRRGAGQERARRHARLPPRRRGGVQDRRGDQSRATIRAGSTPPPPAAPSPPPPPPRG